MRKLILVISIIALLFSTGCGIFNLSNWLIPHDLEFIKLISELNTPEKIATYMEENFTYELNLFSYPSPYTTWQNKVCDCDGYTIFGIFMAYHNDFEVAWIRIYYKDGSITHIIAIYTEDDDLSCTDCWIYLNNDNSYFKTFKEIVDFDCDYVIFKEWSKYIVYDYWDNEIVREYNND